MPVSLFNRSIGDNFSNIKKGVDRIKNGLAFRPGLDFFAKIELKYPQEFTKLLSVKEFEFPSLLLSNGKFNYSFQQKDAVSRTMGGTVIDDWSFIDTTISATNIKAVFDAHLTEHALSFNIPLVGKNIDIPIGFLSRMPLQKTSLQELKSLFSNPEGKGISMNDSIKYMEEKRSDRYNRYMDNRGPFLVDKMLSMFKTNGTLFDQDNIPIISGDVEISTDYIWLSDGNISGNKDFKKHFRPGSFGFVNKLKETVFSDKDFEQSFMDNYSENHVDIIPSTIYRGRFEMFNFSVGGESPYSIDCGFTFTPSFCRKKIMTPDIPAKEDSNDG